MSFSSIITELQSEFRKNMPQVRFLLKKNPGLAYNKINEIAAAVGNKSNLKLSMNFPEKNKIEDIESYGTRDIGLVFHRDSKKFPISRQEIKLKATKFFPDAKIEDAYMYEGKEGLRVVSNKMRLDILPSSLHIWGQFNQNIIEFCNWLLPNCYELKPGVEGALRDTSS